MTKTQEITKTYHKYESQFDFVGYSVAGSGIAVALSAAFGVPLALGLTAAFVGAAVNSTITTKFKKSRELDQHYKDFVDRYSKIKVMQRAVIHFRNTNVVDFAKRSFKPMFDKLVGEMKYHGEETLRLMKEISEDTQTPFTTNQSKIYNAVNTVVNETYILRENISFDEMLEETAIFVKIGTYIFKKIHKLLRDKASENTKKLLLELGDDNSIDKSRLYSELMKSISRDLYNNDISPEQFIFVTRHIGDSYRVGKNTKELTSFL